MDTTTRRELLRLFASASAFAALTTVAGAQPPSTPSTARAAGSTHGRGWTTGAIRA